MIARFWAGLCRLALLASGGIFLGGTAAIIVRFPVAGLLLLVVLIWRSLHRGSVSDAYGSATMTLSSDLHHHGFLEKQGLILGRSLPEKPTRREAIAALISPRVASDAACRMVFAAYVSRRWLAGCLIRIQDFVHLATFSPAGGGKSVASLIPNLLSYRLSCVVIDPKGELASLTAKFRKRKFGHKILILNPFGLGKLGSATLNPLDWIDHTALDFLDQCRDLANTLVLRTGKEIEQHWNDSCELVLTAIIAFVCACEPDKAKRNFKTVRAIVSSRQNFTQAVEVMQQVSGCHGVIQTLGGQLTWFQDKELASVLTTVQRTTQFLDSPVVAVHTASSSFDPLILRQRKATVYLILPHDKLSSLSALLRMEINCIMRRITSGTPTEKNPVLWLLDEMAHLGKIQAIEDAVTLMRGMGMRLWFFFQSQEQLKTCFGDKATTVLDNIATQQYYAVTSYATADEISKRIGDTTIAITTSSSSTSNSRPTARMGQADNQAGSRSSSVTVNRSEIARRVLKPEEIITLSRDTALIFHKNHPVIAAGLCRWFQAREFRRGGTGRSRGLGLAAGIVAAWVLALSCGFAAVATRIATLPQGQVRQAYDRYAPQAVDRIYAARRAYRHR